MRDVEPVVAAEAEEEVVARDLGDRLRLEAEQLADAVVLVDDEVAGAQVGEALQRAAGRSGTRAGALAEDLRVRQQHEPEVAPDEAAPSRRDGEVELRLVGERVAGLEDLRLDPAQQVGRAQRLAAVREGDHDSVPGADEAGELVLGLREPARRDRRTLRLERVRLAARERLELGAALERELDAVLGPDLPYLLRLPDEVRRPVERRHEVVWDRHGLALLAQRRLLQVEAALGRRIDVRALDLVQRALRERRERAHRLDLVAEELDSQRLAAGRREEVDQAAADREVAALLDAVDPFVAGERKLLGQRLEPRLLAGREPDRGGPRLGRRQRLGDRGRRRADEPARREHVEGTRPLADEMRRRLEPRAPANAAARQQRDPLLAEEPARPLGRVAGVGVLGQQHDERAAQLLVQRRQQQRQRGLGDPRGRGQGIRERGQALIVEELLDERVEHGTGGFAQVQDE